MTGSRSRDPRRDADGVKRDVLGLPFARLTDRSIGLCRSRRFRPGGAKLSAGRQKAFDVIAPGRTAAEHAASHERAALRDPEATNERRA
jgi:hypothetical protein